MKLKTILLASLLSLNVSLFALDDVQQYKAEMIYDIGKTYKTNNGLTIEQTLTSIAYWESGMCTKLEGDLYDKGSKVKRPLERRSLGCFHMRLDTAKFVIKKSNLKQYYNLMKDDTKLAKMLRNDLEFSAELTAINFIRNYNIGLNRGINNPWLFAVSRHNGGNKNLPYYNHIKNSKEIIETKKLEVNSIPLIEL